MSERRRFSVRHETANRYGVAPAEVVQLVRLTPTDGPGQRVIHWHIHDIEGRSPAVFLDGFGNRCHLFRRPATSLDAPIVVEGEVETFAWVHGPDGSVAGERLPPSFFLRTTPLTEATADLRAFAESLGLRSERASRARRGRAGSDRDRADMIALAAAIRDRIEHRAGVTTVESSATEALSLGAGVCQDRAHVLLTLARLLGHPARYVSGYCAGVASDSLGAMHAWTEIWSDASGWIGLDPSTGAAVTTSHVRVAIGLDYTSAAPIRGVRRGGSGESLSVSVTLGDAEAMQSQQ